MARSSTLPAFLRAGVRPVVVRLPGSLRSRLQSVVASRKKALAQSSDPQQKPLSDILADELRDVAAPIVVVIGDRKRGEIKNQVLSARPQATVHRFSAALDDSHLHVAIAAVGPCDLLIDASAARSRVRRIRRYIYQLRPGGVVLMLGLLHPEVSDQQRKEFAELVADVGREWLRPSDEQPEGDRARFGRAVRALSLGDDGVVLVGGCAAQAKIREEQVGDLLEARPDLGRVVAQRPAAEQPFRGRIRMSEYDHLLPITTGWMGPTLSLRSYNNVLTSPGQIVTAGSLILPETYRHWTEPRLRNKYVTDLARDFGDATEPAWFAAAPEGGEVRTLPGSYFYLDDEVRGHFGHMLTEVISRLWAWDEAKAADPSLKAIMHFNKHRDLASWEVQLLGAAGIAAEDIVFSREPVRVERLVSATPMLSNPEYVHPGIAEVWQRIGDNLAAQSTVTDTPKRIFIGRRIRKRSCRNATDVERFFESLGFTVVFPEDHPLPDQIQMFRRAELIAGFIGSGMFNLMFTPEPAKAILVASESYNGRNEVLIAGVLGHELNFAWCRSEGEWTGERFKTGGYQAGFTFDFEREGAFVRDVVAGAAAL
jgi:hypothetical protein